MFNDSLFIILFFIFGAIIGSFLNVVIYRTYHNKFFLKARSFCPKCKKMIALYDNIPILSFIFLRGKCRHCKTGISLQYPIVEFITGLLFVIIFFVNHQLPVTNYQLSISLFRDLFITSVLIIIFVQDLKWYIVLDKIILPATLVAFLINLFLGLSFRSLLLAMFIAGGFFLLQFVISKGKWIGGGDIRLGLFMGASLGFPEILIALFLAYILGSFIGIFLIIIGKKKMSSKLPFGTFLAPATLITLFCGDKILEWYLSHLVM
ncbi:prepilin peptidase [Candidatus Falkowbacteria bacterium]|jgi:leader peptidase (prepilin peptidase) / N-methyltransferase|nr:prepilin peptidase [Elusimicrobiaceae bacterium]MBT4433513.1 prepilin peptidase [Candidatus Falkowbacteria bacterium]